MDRLPPSVTLKYPSYRDLPFKGVHLWLAGRRRDDNAEGLWRIYDKLYDFSNFKLIHPGGENWLTLTKGMDITELFETHHISKTPENLLKFYYAKEATKPRNSKLTFDEKGFFKTLKRRISSKIDKSVEWKSKLISDILLFITLSSVILTGYVQSNWMILISGMALTFSTICAHNFFHKRDNWRMKVFNISVMSYRDWRVSHVLSHHHFPNSLSDMEVSYFEPYFLFNLYPKKEHYCKIWRSSVWLADFYGNLCD